MATDPVLAPPATPMAETLESAFEHEMRSAMFSLAAAIAHRHGTQVAARIIDGLYRRYCVPERPIANKGKSI